MNTEINNQKNQTHNDIYLNQSTIDNNLKNNKSLDINNNNKRNNKKIILIIVVTIITLIVLFLLISKITKSADNNTNNDKGQNEINNNNQAEDINENEDQSINNDNEEIIEKDEQSNNADSYLPNSKIIKRSLEETSKFNNGISIKITDSIEYADDDGFYYNPMFIKVEIINKSNKNFYQSLIGHSMYKTYTENPVEFIEDDYNYTNFEIQPMYLLNNEIKTENCGCVLRKIASTDESKIDANGNLYDINYFVLQPNEQTIAYLLCYFREKIEGAEIETIYLYNDTNEFMYFKK